jgi:hypothetical protein
MLPTDYVYTGWAASGEIDIMEAVNIGVETDETGETGPEKRVHGTLHYGKTWPDNVSSGADYKLPNDASPADDFHTYAVEWEEGEMRWFVDNVHFATQTSDGWWSQYEDETGTLVNAEGHAPFDQQFHLILNLAVGGAWAGSVNDTGVDESAFPQSLLVDYVRVYQCSSDMVTGKGCGTVDENAEAVEGTQAPEILTADELFGKGAVFSMYEDTLDEGLSLEKWDNDTGDVVLSEVAATDTSYGTVIQVDKNGAAGNMFFVYEPRVDLSQWEANGHIVFDLNVLNNDASSTLDVKIDSGYPCTSPFTVTLPALNTWGEISVAISDILPNETLNWDGAYSCGADIADVLNPFVLEPSGLMSFQIDNIRYEAPALADQAEIAVFTDLTHAPFEIGQYVASGVVTAEVVAATDTSYGNVAQFTFDTDESVVYFQTADGSTDFDATAFDNVEFDLLVVEDPRSTRVFNVKVDCGHPCGTGDFPIDTPVTGDWTHYSIALDDMLPANHSGSSLDLTKVNTPLVIFPAWGNQNGVVIQVDNVKFTKNP